MGVTCVTSISKRCNADVTQPIFSVTRVTCPLHHVTHTKLHTKKRKYGTPNNATQETGVYPLLENRVVRMVPSPHTLTSSTAHPPLPHPTHTGTGSTAKTNSATKTNSANIRDHIRGQCFAVNVLLIRARQGYAVKALIHVFPPCRAVISVR